MGVTPYHFLCLLWIKGETQDQPRNKGRGKRRHLCMGEQQSHIVGGGVKRWRGLRKPSSHKILHNFPVSPLPSPHLCPCLNAHYLTSIKKLGFPRSKRGRGREAGCRESFSVLGEEQARHRQGAGEKHLESVSLEPR